MWLIRPTSSCRFPEQCGVLAETEAHLAVSPKAEGTAEGTPRVIRRRRRRASPPRKRVLVVEDQLMTATNVEQALDMAGYEVVGPIATLDKALTAARNEPLHCALLDINLRGELVFPAAEELQRRGVPFAFTTAYTDTSFPEQFASWPVLSKPVSTLQLLMSLRALVQKPSGEKH